MSEFLNYAVDRETQSTCLGIVQRAMERSMRGDNVVLGVSGTRKRRVHAKARVNAPQRGREAEITRAQEREILRLRSEGVPRLEVARRMNLRIQTVDYIVYHRSRRAAR